MRAYKVFTHDLRSPIRGGDTIWDGTLPLTLPPVEPDPGPDECARGWNACANLSTALRIAGLWPNGRPSRAFIMESVEGSRVFQREDKIRASSWTVVEEIHDVRPAVRELSAVFGDLADEITEEQMAWRSALYPSSHADPVLVEQGLRVALDVRGLAWSVRRFEDAKDAKAAWAVKATWDAQAAWDAKAAKAAWDAWAARAAWDAWDAKDAWGVWDAWAAWDAWGVWGTWDAKNALAYWSAARRHWVRGRADLLTVGLRDAYAAGAVVVLPTGPTELGWA